VTRATTVRRLTWAALAVASAALVAVVVAATRSPPTPPPLQVVRAVATPWPCVPEGNAAESHESNDRDPVAAEPACEGDVPADQLERGDATLRIRLRGDGDDLPVETEVRLWRLDVPENAAWTAGDEIRAKLVVSKDGAIVDRLPLGRYRLECLDRRHGAKDPPEFALSEGASDFVVRVPNRRWFRLRLRLTDDVGEPIVRSIREPGWSSSSASSGPGYEAPEWARPRQAKGPNAKEFFIPGGGQGDGVGGPPGTLVEATHDGFFDLGRWHEGSTWCQETETHIFRTDARNSVAVFVDDATAADTTFVGVAARIDTLVIHVTCPDGTRLDPKSAVVAAKSRAVRFPWTPPPDAWRVVPVHVKVVRDGCEPLTFDWTAATADAEHRLVAIPPESPK
jgi:hypothetical protein